MANFSPVGGRVSQLQMCPRGFQNLRRPIFVVKHNLSFASLFHLVLEHFCLKPQETEYKTNYPVKMVGLCTKIVDFKIKYLKLWQKVAKTLQSYGQIDHES